MMSQEWAWNPVVMCKAVDIQASCRGQSKGRDEGTAMAIRQTTYKQNGTI